MSAIFVIIFERKKNIDRGYPINKITQHLSVRVKRTTKRT